MPSSALGAISICTKAGAPANGRWLRFRRAKNDLTLYIVPGFDRYQSLLDELGKHKTGKSCLYVKRLADIDLTVLKAVIESSVILMAAKRMRPT